MVRKAYKIVISVIAVVLAFILLNLLFMPTYIGENVDGRITAEYYREKTNIDVIFVGSSTVQAGISPMTLYKEYGVTAYNRSNSSQVIPISLCMVQDAIKRNKPKLVVLDVGFLYQADDYVDEGSSRKSMDSLKWSKYKVDCIKAIMDDTESFTDYVFPILRFHSRWNDLKLDDLKYWIYKPTVTYNGQLLQFDTINKEFEYNPYNLEDDIVASNRTIEYLQKLVDTCDDNNVQIMFIKMPMIKGNWNNGIDEQITKVASDNNIKYYNYIDSFEDIGLVTLEDFSDEQHMNSIGAEKFTKYLGEYIIKNYDISNRVDDLSYKKVFDEKLRKYDMAMENRIPSEPRAE